MTKQIALLVDSGMTLPEEILALPGVYEIPLNIIYKDAVYTDKVDITAEDIYARLDEEIPSTSLPSGQTIHYIMEKIIADGYQELLIVTISSGLSGTHNAVKLIAEDFPQLTCALIDTKSITLGGGLQGAYAKELIDHGLSLTECEEKLNTLVSESRVYFSLPTLEYLKKGGRIGLVSSVIGSALNLHPVVSCNEDGVYHTAAKARGRKRSVAKMVETASDFIGDSTSYDMGVAHAFCETDARNLAAFLKDTFPHIRNFYFEQASPALGIHTGPDAFGMTVLKHN
ncbi:DegV family protein [Vagococcus coleopterorum]|uniref:DegV family protein n=1 Tax=Vagococcus coleopterorum TaxID=2714946 RepID=A0A6G8ALA7_9ENTE|nr:DegV family protein [Vagococcus coleopterorum]QIL45874.1 DegV family protein [Vagococcus coleopterorum]